MSDLLQKKFVVYVEYENVFVWGNVDLGFSLIITIIIFCVDGLHFGFWENKMSQLKAPKLRENASRLPILMQAAYADSTLSKYKPAWLKFVEWSNQFEEIQTCPADPFHVALYFNDLTMNHASFTAINNAYMGIRWGHINVGFYSPTDHPFVKVAFEGAKRLSDKASNQKEPVTPECLKELVNAYGFSKNILELRFLLICLLGFSGFFRISELLEVQKKHITFCKDYVEIYVEKSKCDQLREGHIVKISVTGTTCCPVYWLNKYLDITGLRDFPEGYLICKLYKTKKGHNVHHQSGITYDTARKTFLEHMKKLYPNEIKGFGLHSLRSGGASAAIENDVSERLIDKHGRWKSGGSRNRYIKDSNEKRLSVTKSLGI